MARELADDTHREIAVALTRRRSARRCSCEQLDQRAHAVLGERVVDARAQATDRAMAAQARQPARLGRARAAPPRAPASRAAERDVHVRAAARLRVRAPASAADRGSRRAASPCARCARPSRRARPARGSTRTTSPIIADAERVRRVVHRALASRTSRYCASGGRSVAPVSTKSLSRDHERDARRAEVLLRAGVDQAVVRERQRPAEDVARRIAHERRRRAGGGAAHCVP